MIQKLQLAEQPPKPERVPAEQLTPGQFLAAGALTTGRPTEVLFVDTYSHPGGGRESLIVHRPLGVTYSISAAVNGNHWFDLATAEQLAEFRAGAERAQKIGDIRALADWLEENPDVPMPYFTRAYEHWNGNPGDPTTAAGMATIRNLGQMFESDLDESLDRTKLTIPFGQSASYELVVWHKDGRPADPKPLVDPDASMEAHYDAEADRVPHPTWPTEAELKPWESLAPLADRIAESMEPVETHQQIGGSVGGPGENSAECACGVVFDGFDSATEANVQLSWHIADPSGQDYGRADTAEADDPTPVSGARVPPHTGAMTDEGLVDETVTLIRCGCGPEHGPQCTQGL